MSTAENYSPELGGKSSQKDGFKDMEVPIKNLKPLLLVRKDFGDLNALAESIKKEGLLNRLIVTKAEDDQYYVICGLRRLMASSIAGLEKLPVKVIPHISIMDALVMIYNENELRKRLTPAERAKLVCLIRMYHGLNQAAKRLRLPKSTVETLYRAGFVLTAAEKVRSSNSGELKTSIKLAEKVYEAVKKAGYTGKRFDEIAGSLYVTLSRLPLSKALWALSKWSKTPNLEAIQKVVSEAISLKTDVANFRIPNINERMRLEVNGGENFEKLLLEGGYSKQNEYEVDGKVLVRIAHFKDWLSDVYTFLCPRCGMPMRCRVCGSLVVDLCGFPHPSVRIRNHNRYIKTYDRGQSAHEES